MELLEVVLGMPWDGAFANPVAKPTQAALHASAAAVNRINRLDAVGIADGFSFVIGPEIGYDSMMIG